MNQWLNMSHPQTLRAAVFLGYLSAFFGLLFGPQAWFLLPVYIGVGIGAFVTANNRRWGYILLAACAWIIALFMIWRLLTFTLAGGSLENILLLLNGTVFPTALAMAVIHAQSREYQQVWFE